MSEPMDATEQRCWSIILKNRHDITAQGLAVAAGVTVEYAQSILDRIASPNWREPVDGEMFDAETGPERIRLLKRGIELTGGDRNKSYGPPYDNFTNCAVMWKAYLIAKYGGCIIDELNLELVAEDVAHMMTLVKMTRSFHGSYHADNYLDGAVYQAIAGECRIEEERE